tara:strand:- start:256 stop:453 length:198 start_codon:yes stop_codon:yes gene_type:complete
MSEFFSMGGYALYVWSSWGIGVAVLVGITWHSLSQARHARIKLDDLEHPDNRSNKDQQFESDQDA